MDASLRRLPYAPALDGLRAIACLSVMLYHAEVLPGGFLGVDVFFTLSGFLITSLLLDETGNSGGIDFRAFWRRRVFRILPLYAVVILTFFVWGLWTDSPAGHDTVVGALAGLLFATNWLLSTHPVTVGALGAGWSVAAEEQFYVVWPLALAGLLRLFRTERRVAGAVVAAAAAVAVHRYHMAPHVPWARVWHGVETHADALLLGCAVALGWRNRSRLVGRAAGLALALFFLLAFETPITAQFVIPAVAVATALAIPVLQEHGGWLARRPWPGIGKRSYGLYLWGYPINYLALEVYGIRGLPLLAIVFPATFLVAEVTYRLVELPLRELGRRPVRRSPASATAPGGRLRLSLRRP